MNFKLLPGVDPYPALPTSTTRTPLNMDESWTVSHEVTQPQGVWHPPACKLTDSKAVIELEAAEHLVDISGMIKAVASYHNLKGFCK